MKSKNDGGIDTSFWLVLAGRVTGTVVYYVDVMGQLWVASVCEMGVRLWIIQGAILGRTSHDWKGWKNTGYRIAFIARVTQRLR